MVEAKTLSAYFDELRKETLPSLGMEDSQLLRIISARLLVERVGERDANYWWDSQVLSDFGQGTLDETVPRTATRSQIELAMKVGRKVENEAIGEEAVSLFDLGPFVESQIQREIDKIDNEVVLDILTDQSVEITETGWTESLTEGEVTVEPGMGTSYKLGSISLDDLKEGEVLDDVVSQLISGYGNATKQNLQIPYYSVKQ
jgi:phage gp46-like protein